MTEKEKAIIILENEQPHCGEKITFTEEERYEAYNLAIKALEQEPFDVGKYCEEHWVVMVDRDVFEDTEKKLKEQEPKTGHWIMKHRTHNEIKHYTGQDEMGETHTISVLERYETDEPYCSECGKRAGDTSQNYCCACGAKMIEPQESEG